MSEYFKSIFSLTCGWSTKNIDQVETTHKQVSFAGTTANAKNDDQINLVKQSNRRTIYAYQSVGAIAFIAHLAMVTIPSIQSETFTILSPEGWQTLTLTLLPLIINMASVSAMNEFNKPLDQNEHLDLESSGLDFNKNHFVHSLKALVVFMAFSQIMSIVSSHFIWIIMLIVPIWCYKIINVLAANIAKAELESSLSKASMNVSSKGSKSRQKTRSTPSKSVDPNVGLTPRTRTRKAVRNIIDGVSEKCQAIGKQVNQESARLVLPASRFFGSLSPKLKMIDRPKKQEQPSSESSKNEI